MIDKILEHEGFLDKRRDLQFKVHWKGYETEDDSWVPYSELRDTAALHQYLLGQTTKEFHKLIPPKFFKNGRYAPDDE